MLGLWQVRPGYGTGGKPPPPTPWESSQMLSLGFGSSLKPCHTNVYKCSGTIAACVAAGITWGAELAGCIGAAIGTADVCYQCVCDVIEWLGMGSC